MMLASLLATATAHPGFYRRTHTYLDQDQVMAYDPAAGSYSVLQLIRGSARRSGCQTFNPMPLRRGELPAFRKHAYLGEERLLEVDPQNGDFRVLCFNRTAPCSLDAPETPATFGQVVQKGRLLAFVDADVITSVGHDEVLIQHRATAGWSIHMYDRNADLPPPRAFVEAQALHALAPGETEFGQPFPGEPVASGRFGRPSPLSLMYAGKGLLLGYSAGGPHWGLWSYDRTATGGDSSALRLSRSGLWSRNVSSSALDSSVQRELTCLGGDLVLEYEPGSCGYTVWPLLRAEQLPYASSLHTDPLRQSAPPLDAGSFCRPACSGTCASAADGAAGCGWCRTPRGGWGGRRDGRRRIEHLEHGTAGRAARRHGPGDPGLGCGQLLLLLRRVALAGRRLPCGGHEQGGRQGGEVRGEEARGRVPRAPHVLRLLGRVELRVVRQLRAVLQQAGAERPGVRRVA